MRQSTWLVFLVTTHLALYSFVVLRPKMPVFMASMDHRTVGGSQVQFFDKVFYMPVVVLRVVLRSRQCSLLFGVSAVAVHHGRRHSLSMRSGSSPWSCLFRYTIEIPQFVFGGRCPCLQGSPQVQSWKWTC